jgi:molecular chaperone DnaK
MSTHKTPALGIDFGTTSSAIATVVPDSDGRTVPRAVIWGDHLPKIATAVYIREDGEYAIGDEALEAGANDPARLYTEFKRNLDLDHPYLRPLPDGTPVSANVLARHVIEKLMHHPEEGISEITKVVLCHPVGDFWARIFTQILLDSNIDYELLSEPEAALYYAHNKHHIFDERNETVLLIDFGGGTCDFILMKVQASLWRGLLRPKPEIIDEDRLDLGGKDLDQIVKEELIRRWEQSHPKIAHLSSRFDTSELSWHLTESAKQVKERLSKKHSEGKHNEALPIKILGLPGNSKLETEMTADTLRHLTEDVIHRKFYGLLVEDDEKSGHRALLGRKDIKPDDVTMVILAGGSSRLPWIRENILPAIFPALAARKRIILLAKPEMSVAFGAALYAHDLNINRTRLPRFLQEDLSIELADGSVHQLLEHGTTLPVNRHSTKAFHVFRFPETGKILPIKLVAGRSHRASECRSLSFEPKQADFDETIEEGTRMKIQVAVSIKGEVQLYISPVSPWAKGKKATLFFNPLHLSLYRGNQ